MNNVDDISMVAVLGVLAACLAASAGLVPEGSDNHSRVVGWKHNT
jgi:hypothetical protein